MLKTIDIIVINWNSGETTLNAVRPYINYKSPAISCKVIVVDNASIDNSVIKLRGVANKLITNDKNVGFGKACNQAFEGSAADYILLLNPDTISEPTVLEKLVEFLEKNPDYGIIGPSQLGKNKKILKTCGRFPTFKSSIFEILGLSKLFPNTFIPAPIMLDWDHLESKEVDQVMGSYMVIRKSILDTLGFMDDDYFVYGEDTDLSKRFKNAGYKSFYSSKYSIFHECGGTGESATANRLFYSLSSRRIYWKKHLGRLNSQILTILSITIEPILRVMDSLFRKKKPGINKIAKAYMFYIKEIIGL